MAETQAAIGYGTVLEYYTGGSPDEYVTLAEVTDLTGPGMSRELPDATHMQSPDGYREFLGGLKDGGEITVECNHLPNHATHGASTGVLALFESGNKTSWRIRFPTSPEVVWTLNAVVSAFEPSFPIDDKMMLSITLKVSGKPAFVDPE